ncbi:MAG: family 10 glycosylhydrolase [Candidatus Sumerlaeia bacterium]|nr:family 10 glycosylhydrolase [Candidatus Sumerlaeia bacterium]
MKQTVIALGVLIIGFTCASYAGNEVKFPGLQAVYLRPEVLTTSTAEMYLSDIKRWGAGEVFLEAGYDNKVIHHSKIFPCMDKQNDWLKIYCELARKYGLKLHVWIKVCYWVHHLENLENFPILKNNPDWIDVNKKGEIVISSNEGTYEERAFVFVNPAVPGVIKALQDYIKELSAYDIDGISIDYIRFKSCRPDPETWFGYNKYSVEKFKAETGLDPYKIIVDKTPNSPFMRWVAYNERVIENCVKSIAECLDGINTTQKKNIILSASPFTNYVSGENSKFQNWTPWDAKSYIKLWLPMCMSVDMQALEKEINGVKALGLKAPFYPVVYPNQHGVLHPPMSAHYTVLKKCGITSFAVFSYKQLKQEFEN